MNITGSAITSVGLGRHAVHYVNNIYLPARIIENGAYYAELPTAQIQAAFDTTKNAHEFLSLFRYLNGKTQENATREMGLSRTALGKWEIGAELPKAENLARLAKYIGPNLYPRFETLLIENRLAMARGTLNDNTDRWGIKSTRNKGNSATSLLLGEMPPRYWRAVLDHFLTGNFPSEADWQKDIISIQTKAQFLFAARHYLSKKKEDVEQETGINAAVIMNLENGWNNPEAGQGNQLASFYRVKSEELKNDSEATSLKPFFDTSKYGKLESGYFREEVNRHRSAAYHRRNRNGISNSASR